MVEGDIVKELGQFLDVGLIGYQFVIPSFPFSPQLVNYQGQASVHFEQFDVKVNYRWIPRAHASYSSILFMQSKPDLVMKGMH